MSKEPLHVLIIEDNPSDVMLQAAALGREYKISISKNLREGIGCIEMDTPDVILLDVGLPDASDPMDVLQRIVKMNPLIPVIVVTGSVDPSFGRIALRFGAQDYIKKEELDPLRLRAAIDFSIERHRWRIGGIQAGLGRLDKLILEFRSGPNKNRRG